MSKRKAGSISETMQGLEVSPKDKKVKRRPSISEYLEEHRSGTST